METGIHALTAGYALDALDADERRAFEEHLAACERCQTELAALSEATHALAVAASGPEPSPDLRERILADVRMEAPTVEPFAGRRRRRAPAFALAATLAAALILGVGLWGARLSDELDDTRSALERERATAAILADPAARIVALRAGDGRLVVAPDGRAVVVLGGLQPAPAGKTYQLWIVPGGDIAAATSGGLLTGADPTDVALVDGTVADGDVVAVTIEEAGGVAAPTTAPIAASDPV